MTTTAALKGRPEPLNGEEKAEIWQSARWALSDGEEMTDRLPFSLYEWDQSLGFVHRARRHLRQAYKGEVALRYWRFVQRAEVRRARNERRHMARARSDVAWLELHREKWWFLVYVAETIANLGWGWGVDTICWDGGYPTDELHSRPIGHVMRRSPYLHPDDNGGGEDRDWPVHECEADTPAEALFGAFRQAVESWSDLGPEDDPTIPDLPETRL